MAQRDFSQMVAAGTGQVASAVHFEAAVTWKWTRLDMLLCAVQSYHYERYQRLMVVDYAVDNYSD